MEKYCSSCRHYPNDEHCHGCVWDSKTQRNTHWEPQEPFINKPCISEGVCHEDKMKVLEKIKAEMLDIMVRTYQEINAIINKYMEESEVSDADSD